MRCRWMVTALMLALAAPLAAETQRPAAGAVTATRWEVPAELWERPRSGAALLASAAVRAAVDAWLTAPGARLRVHHGGGDEALLQAEELRAWLIALAVEAARIELVADLPSRAPLYFELVHN